MDKPKVGDRLFSLNVGNAARNSEQKLTPVTVRKVGRKYFTVYKDVYKDREDMDIQYHIDSWSENTEYSANSCLYVTEKEHEEEMAAKAILKQIKDFFDWFTGKRYKISLDDLSKIKAILDKYNG